MSRYRAPTAAEYLGVTPAEFERRTSQHRGVAFMQASKMATIRSNRSKSAGFGFRRSLGYSRGYLTHGWSESKHPRDYRGRFV